MHALLQLLCWTARTGWMMCSGRSCRAPQLRPPPAGDQWAWHSAAAVMLKDGLLWLLHGDQHTDVELVVVGRGVWAHWFLMAVRRHYMQGQDPQQSE